MVDFLMWVLIALMLLIALYFIIDHYFPTYGTVITNFLAGLPFGLGQLLDALKEFVDGAQVLPWDKILQPKQVGAILFAVAAANMFFRMRGPKKAVGSG